MRWMTKARTADQQLKLTGAAMWVSRGMKILHAAPGGSSSSFVQSFVVHQIVEKSPQSSVRSSNLSNKKFNCRPILSACF